jgi:hypothetical protein
LRTLLEWLEAGAHPVMAQLPQAEWIDRWQAWDLPAPPDGAA